jgi:hypothetical protein
MNGSIIIPERFRLNGKTYIVIIDDDYCDSEKAYGEADFTTNTITLCGKYKGKKLRKIIREKTFIHELVHQILHSMNKTQLKWNEDFVETFADRLYEYEKTKQ